MLSEATLAALCDPLGLNPAHLQFVSQAQNYVYTHTPPGGPSTFFRISHARHRTLCDITAELLWIQHLANQGLPVVPALEPPIMLPGPVPFIAAHFPKAAGRAVAAADLTLVLYQRLGNLIAHLHAASFDDPAPQPPRFPWYESRLLTHDLDRCMPPSAQSFRDSVRALIAETRAATATPLRLIHADLSFSNIFLSDDNALSLIDFDNCELGTEAQDLAVVLYDSIYCKLLNKVAEPELSAELRRRWESVLTGYTEIRPLPDLSLMRNHLVLREAVIYTHYHRTLDVANLRPEFQQGMDDMRKDVEAGITRAYPYSSR